MMKSAGELGWTTSRFQKAVNRVIQLLKIEEKEKEEKNDKSKDKD